VAVETLVDEALGVAWLDPRRRSRIEAPHPSIELACAALGGQAIEHRPQRLVPGRTRKQAADEGAEVEAGAADEDRQAPASGDAAYDRRRVLRVAGCGVDLRRLRDVDQVVRDALLLVERHLVGADVDAAEHRGRIAGHDLAAEVARQGDAECALPRRGRAEDGDESRPAHEGDRGDSL